MGGARLILKLLLSALAFVATTPAASVTLSPLELASACECGPFFLCRSLARSLCQRKGSSCKSVRRHPSKRRLNAPRRPFSRSSCLANSHPLIYIYIFICIVILRLLAHSKAEPAALVVILETKVIAGKGCWEAVSSRRAPQSRQNCLGSGRLCCCFAVGPFADALTALAEAAVVAKRWAGSGGVKLHLKNNALGKRAKKLHTQVAAPRRLLATQSKPDNHHTTHRLSSWVETSGAALRTKASTSQR